MKIQKVFSKIMLIEEQIHHDNFSKWRTFSGISFLKGIYIYISVLSFYVLHCLLRCLSLKDLDGGNPNKCPLTCNWSSVFLIVLIELYF